MVNALTGVSHHRVLFVCCVFVFVVHLMRACVCVSVCVVCLSVCLSLSVCLCIWAFVCLSICLSSLRCIFVVVVVFVLFVVVVVVVVYLCKIRLLRRNCPLLCLRGFLGFQSHLSPQVHCKAILPASVYRHQYARLIFPARACPFEFGLQKVWSWHSKTNTGRESHLRRRRRRRKNRRRKVNK